MTYKELRDLLDTFTPEQLNQTVSVYVRVVDEIYPVTEPIVEVTDDSTDVLDPGHKFLIV